MHVVTHWASVIVVLSVLLVAGATARAVTLKDGDLLVTDAGFNCSATEPTDGVFLVDVGTGQRTPITTGGRLECPSGVTVTQTGSILITDQIALGGAVFEIDPSTGSQTVVTTGGNLALPWRVVADSDGTLVVSNFGFGDDDGTVVRVDPVTGEQTLLSRGGLLRDTGGIVKDDDRNFIVTNFSAPEVVKVDRVSGSQTIVASGSTLFHALDVARDRDGTLVVIGFGALGDDPSPPGAVSRVDPATGGVTTISSDGQLQHGEGIALGADGTIFALDRFCCGGNGPIVRIDPATGEQLPIQSPQFVTPLGIAVVRLETSTTTTTTTTASTTSTTRPLSGCLSFPCGDVGRKRLVCHRSGGNGAPSETLCIDASAVPVHLAQHGDHCGPCR